VTVQLIIEQPAKVDLAEAVKWHRELRNGLEEEFLLCVDEGLERIIHYPEANQILFRHLRRALVHRFPYGIFYLYQRPVIRVVGVMHMRRKPSIWYSRSH